MKAILLFVFSYYSLCMNSTTESISSRNLT